jgi:hypothetical protein
MPIDPRLRNELVRRARDKRLRQGGSKNTKQPCRWFPYEVLHPESGLPFTEVGAWNFIADLIESGHHLEAIVMAGPDRLRLEDERVQELS